MLNGCAIQHGKTAKYFGTNFKLRATVMHMLQTVDFVHYTCIVKYYADKWNAISDIKTTSYKVQLSFQNDENCWPVSWKEINWNEIISLNDN